MYLCPVIKTIEIMIYQIAKDRDFKKTKYYSVNGNEYFDGENPLQKAKSFAKEKGCKYLTVIDYRIGKENKTYKL